jgi:uncharacterized protein (TIGR02594 family)
VDLSPARGLIDISFVICASTLRRDDAMLSLGSRGTDVTRLQLAIDAVVGKVLRVKADGFFGPRTRDAVIAFQKSKGLAPDGQVGPATMAALFGNRPVGPPVFSDSQISQAGWMRIADAEFGVHRDMIQHRNARIIEYLKTTSLGAADANTDSTAWCSAFVNWVMIKSGRTGTNNALASSWLDWKQGQAKDPPTFGSIVVIKKKNATSDQQTGSHTGNHVGFCVDYSPGHLRMLGGNQGSAVSLASFSLQTWGIRGAKSPSQ